MRKQLPDYNVGGAWIRKPDEKPYFYELYNHNTDQVLRIYFQKDGTFDRTESKLR